MSLSHYLWKQVKFSFFGLIVASLESVLQIVANKVKGIGTGQLRKKLLLLGLIVQNLSLWITEEREY